MAPSLGTRASSSLASLLRGGCSLLLVAVAALLIGGCGSQSKPPANTTPRAPAAGDLRFKQVDAPSVANMGSGDAHSGGIMTDASSGMFVWDTNANGILEIAADEFSCTPGTPGYVGCGWWYFFYGLPPGVTGLVTHFYAGDYVDFNVDMQQALTDANTVLTCLDFEPGSDAYAAGWTVSSQATGFDMRQKAVPPSQVQATASQDGLESRVITAVSFDAQGQANLFSYGWQSDPSTVYEVQTAIIEPERFDDGGRHGGGRLYHYRLRRQRSQRLPARRHAGAGRHPSSPHGHRHGHA